MKRNIILLFLTCFVLLKKQHAQILLNELYTDPGSGRHEFFELYNTSTSASPVSMNNYTMVTFFDISGQKGFYVMDLPNFTVSPKGYFVGSAALPFNYQGVNNSTASDFSWNSAAFTANNGSLKKWVQATVNLLDGNLFYDQAVLPANFNDFFFRRTGSGSSYTVFLYSNGTLINTFLGGTGGQAEVVNAIISMPSLHVDMTGSSPDFTINFSGYGSLPLEYCNQDAGSDNGFIREQDGGCYTFVKSSAQVQHTPKASNGILIGVTSGSLSISAAISPGTEAAGSTLNYDIVAGPAGSFPAEMQIYIDVGTFGRLDPADVFLTSKIENNVSEGPFYTTFFPYNVNILIVVKTSAGCLDKILFIPNSLVLSVKMITFDGSRQNNNTQLKWQVDENESIDRFELERSINGEAFTDAGITFSTDKRGTEKYSFTETVHGDVRVSYRLKTIDKGGVASYSRLLAFDPVKNKPGSGLNLLGNPVSDRLQFNYTSHAAVPIEIKVYSVSGRIVLTQKAFSTKGNNSFSFSLPASIGGGLYIVEVWNGTERKMEKFLKQ